MGTHVNRTRGGHCPGLPGHPFLLGFLDSRSHRLSLLPDFHLRLASCSRLPPAGLHTDRPQGSHAVSRAGLSQGKNGAVISSKPQFLPNPLRGPSLNMVYFHWFCHCPPAYPFQLIVVMSNFLFRPMEVIVIEIITNMCVDSGFGIFFSHHDGFVLVTTKKK